MRLRIIKKAQGVVDGVSLRSLVSGRIYDVDQSVGRYLVAAGFAKELPPTGDDPQMSQDTPYAVEQLTKGVTVLPPGEVLSLEKRRERVDRRKTHRSSDRRHK